MIASGSTRAPSESAAGGQLQQPMRQSEGGGLEFLERVNLDRLIDRRRWPIMSLLAPHFVEEIELGRHLRRLLATHHWSVVTAVHVPGPEGRSGASRVVDIYGRRV
jgi:hypothetical protein